MWQFTEVVEGMSEACEALAIPVIGGNVTFYNASSGVDIHPTPIVGVLGFIDELEGGIPGSRFGRRRVDRGARRDAGRARWLRVGGGRARARGGRRPAVDLDAGRRSCTRWSGRAGASARGQGRARLSDGGVAVTLCEMAFGGGTGFRVDLLTDPAPACARPPRPRSASRRRGWCWPSRPIRWRRSWARHRPREWQPGDRVGRRRSVHRRQRLLGASGSGPPSLARRHSQPHASPPLAKTRRPPRHLLAGAATTLWLPVRAGHGPGRKHCPPDAGHPVAKSRRPPRHLMEGSATRFQARCLASSQVMTSAADSAGVWPAVSIRISGSTGGS